MPKGRVREYFESGLGIGKGGGNVYEWGRVEGKGSAVPDTSAGGRSK